MKEVDSYSVSRKWISCALVAGCLTAASSLAAVELYTSDTEEPEPRQPVISLAGGYADVKDGLNEALALEQDGLQDGVTGGIERLYWENGSDGDWKFYVDSFALLDPDRYGVNLEMHNGYNVFFDLNFLQWHEYDFGSGIWYPITDTFAVLSANALEQEINKLDISLRFSPRDSLWIELAYGFFNRDGQSLSTRFGDNFQYRVPGGMNSRGIIPALMEGEETVHTFDAKLTREDGIDRAGLRFHYQRRSVDRQHVVERATAEPSANRTTTQKEESTDDLFSMSGFNRTEIGDNLTGSIGFVFTRLDGDLTGSRIFGSAPEATYDIDFAALQFEDRGFLDLENTRKLNQWVFNGNLVYTPSETMRWMGGVRIEHLSTEAFSSYIDTYSTVDWTAGEFQREEARMLARSEKSALDVSAFLEARYSGIEHMLLYSRVEASTQGGDLDEDWSRQETNPDVRSPVDLIDRATDFDRQVAFWEVGMNYYPLAKMRISLQAYLKYRENGYDWGGVTLPVEDYTLYPGHIANQVLTTRDVNGRLHYRIFDSLKSVTRIDFQETTIDSEDSLQFSLESSTRERVMFNQSLTWTPSPRVFVTGTFNLVDDLTESKAAELEGVFSGIIVNVPNDYWQANLNVYTVVSKLIDIQLGYQFMEMSNYLNTAPKTVPYGKDLTQHHGSVQMIFHLNEWTRSRLGYDYYEYDEPSADGNRNYKAHLVSGSLQVIF
jgi:hypothetical protein